MFDFILAQFANFSFFEYFIRSEYHGVNDSSHCERAADDRTYLQRDRKNSLLDSLCIKLRKSKGPCATLVLRGRAVFSERVNKPYMNCKQHENIKK